MKNQLDSILQMRKVADGCIRFVHHAVPASEKEIDVFSAARAISEAAALYTQQVAFRSVRKFSILSRVENHNTAITKNEKNAKLVVGCLAKQNTKQGTK
jgi:hypothetical protein